MPTQVKGRRVADIQAIERAGDYCVRYAEDGRVFSVWFAMPGFPYHFWNRINGPASQYEPRWEVTEDDEGRVTISPSILSWWKWKGEDQRFHCFMRAGVWEILDDTVGAVFGE
jgi:hypothetical protein